MAWFRLFGVLVLLLDLPWLLNAIAELPYGWAPTPRQLSWLAQLAFGAVVGVGLLFLRKWAALYFALPLFGYGLWLAIISVEAFCFPVNLLCMAEGGSLMLPLVVTIRVWPQLTWGGRWFL